MWHQPAIDPGTFWHYPKRFFWSEGKKIEKFDVFRGKFSKFKPKSLLADPTRPKPQKFDPTLPGSKILTQTRHYPMVLAFDLRTWRQGSIPSLKGRSLDTMSFRLRWFAYYIVTGKNLPMSVNRSLALMGKVSIQVKKW